jgi:hypothetical protein
LRQGLADNKLGDTLRAEANSRLSEKLLEEKISALAR